MRRILAPLLTASAIALLGVSPAAAGPSCYVELGAGGALSSQRLDQAGASVTIAGDGYTGTIGLGCDYKLEQIVAGIRGRYEVSKISGNLMGDAWKANDAWEVALRAGYLIQPSILLYGVAGLKGTEIDYAGALNLDTKGLMFGGGLELEISKHLALYAEYNHVQYGGWHDAGATLKPSTDAVMLGIRLRFDSLLPQ